MAIPAGVLLIHGLWMRSGQGSHRPFRSSSKADSHQPTSLPRRAFIPIFDSLHIFSFLVRFQVCVFHIEGISGNKCMIKESSRFVLPQAGTGPTATPGPVNEAGGKRTPSVPQADTGAVGQWGGGGGQGSELGGEPAFFLSPPQGFLCLHTLNL